MTALAWLGLGMVRYSLSCRTLPFVFTAVYADAISANCMRQNHDRRHSRTGTSGRSGRMFNQHMMATTSSAAAA